MMLAYIMFKLRRLILMFAALHEYHSFPNDLPHPCD